MELKVEAQQTDQLLDSSHSSPQRTTKKILQDLAVKYKKQVSNSIKQA